VDTLPAGAWARLLEFVAQGGKLVAIGEMPLNSDTEFPDAKVRDAFAGVFEQNPNAVLMADWKAAALDELLSDWLKKPVRLADETQPLRLAHKKVHKSDVFFVMNDSKAKVTATITFDTDGKLEEWDPATAEVRTVSNKSEIQLEPYHGRVYRTR
jgi:hypothetical protein